MTVAVVGAGPGGLTAALTAARHGFQVICYEARSRLESRGCWVVGPRAQTVLSRSGVRFEGRKCSEMRLVTEDDRLLYRVRYRAGGEARVVSRQHLLDRLKAACSEAGVLFRMSTRLEQPPPGRVVIGADGCHSKVREWAGVSYHARPLGHYYRGQISASPVGQPQEIWAADGRRFGFDPACHETGFYCTAPAEDPDDWEQFIEGWNSPLARATLRACDPATMQRCRPLDIWCPRWSNPPYFLVGDAAHGQPPNLGQGANLALIDGYVLGSLLGRHGDLDAVAEEYQRGRAMFCHRLHLISVAGCWFSHQPSPLRDQVMRWLDRIGFVKPWLLSQAGCENPREGEFVYD